MRLLFAVLILLWTASDAAALPIFARKYQTSCTTCHVIIPKLNPFGIAFRNNGYRIPVADEKFIKDDPVALGAPAWKKVWPKAVWPGDIQGLPPFALRVLTDVNTRPSRPVNVNLDFPHELEAYFAGTSGESFSFFGAVEFIGATNTISIQKAFGQFRLLETNLLNIKVGRIDSRADPFSRSFRRLTSQHYGPSDYQAVPGGFRFRDRDAGLEFWGAGTGPGDKGGVEYGVGVLQGTGGAPENNNYKDYYWTASYKFGGLGVTGSRSELEELASEKNYAEYSLLIGTFGHRGRSPVNITGALEDRYERTGLKFDAYIQDLNLYGAVVLGKDRLIGLNRAIDTSSFFLEGDYVLLPWVVPLLRFEKTNYSNQRNVIQVIPATNIALRANIRLLLEARLYNKRFREAAARTGTNEFRARLDFLF